ncbi:hypothetical protein D3C86_2050150 [compost metagenome]
MLATDLLQRGLQVGAADAAAAGDEAAGVVLGGNHDLVVLEGGIQRGGNPRGGGDIFCIHVGSHCRGYGQAERKRSDNKCAAHGNNPLATETAY